LASAGGFHGTRWRNHHLRRTTTFDGFGRAIKLQTGHDSTTVNTVDTVYGACGCSPLGKVVKVSLPYGPGETEVWTTYTYDASGRQLTSTAPDGSVTTTSYSGNSVTTTDPAGAWKTNVTDAFGNLIAVYEPDPATGTTTSNSPVTFYTYNGANQLVGVSMTRAGVTQNRTFAYSGSDLASETTPEAGTVTYTYDANHHVTSRTDAKGQQTQYTYDGYERLAEVRHYTPTGANGALVEQTGQRVDYYYDTQVDSSYTQNYTWGRLSAVVFQSEASNQGLGPWFTYEYSYNQAGRVTGNRMLVAQGPSYALDLKGQYAWDSQGRMTSMTYPSGPVMTYQFDPMGRPSTMSQTGLVGGTLPATATYGSASQLLTLSYGTNVAPFTETRAYNNMLQLTHLTNWGVDMQYIYNTGHNNGRVAQTIDSVLGETVNYSYDYLHRLTAATATNSSWGEGYSYDGFGNLTGKTPTVGTAPVFLGSAGSNNAGGNLPPGFDVENRLIYSAPSGISHTYNYVYDPWGRRVWKQDNNVSGGTTYEAYFYSATGQKLETYSCGFGPPGLVNSTLEGINTYFIGKLLSENGVYVATDRLGSVRHDSNGVSLSYFPWGEERGAGTADNRTKFAGYFRDVIGQDYANARYYSATSGSFWSPDPGGMKTADPTNPIRWNRYLYASGDPINRIDPLGREDCDPDDDEPCFETEVDASADDGGGGDDDGGGDDGGGDCGTDTPQKQHRGKQNSGPPAPCNSAIMQSQYLMIFGQMGKDLGVDPLFVMAVSLQESGWNLSHVFGTNASSNGQPLNNLFGSTYAGGDNIPYPSVQASATAWEKNWGSYLANQPYTIQGFVNDLTSNPKHMYNSNPDWKISIAGGTLSNGKKTSGTYNTLKKEFTDCNIAPPTGK
jgi:RHS repeat-associated protein